MSTFPTMTRGSRKQGKAAPKPTHMYSHSEKFCNKVTAKSSERRRGKRGVQSFSKRKPKLSLQDISQQASPIVSLTVRSGQKEFEIDT